MRLTEGSRLPPLQTLSALDYQVDQVRFAIEPSEVRAKLKLSQNRSKDDRARVEAERFHFRIGRNIRRGALFADFAHEALGHEAAR